MKCSKTGFQNSGRATVERIIEKSEKTIPDVCNITLKIFHFYIRSIFTVIKLNKLLRPIVDILNSLVCIDVH